MNIVRCPGCRLNVVPGADGACPSCRQVLDHVEALAFVEKPLAPESTAPPEPDWAALEREDSRKRGRSVLHLSLAVTLFVAALLVIAVGVAFAIGMGGVQNARGVSKLIAVAFVVTLGPILYAASQQFDHAKRLRQRDARLVLRDDPRPPVIYLRSFIHDASRQNPLRVVRSSGGVPLVVFSPPVHEVRLARVFRRVGPVIAVGKPGEPMPELGASRLYLEDAWWQPEVLRLVRSAALVVIRVSTTPGTYWEMVNVFRSVPGEKIVLFFAPKGRLDPELESILPAGITCQGLPDARFVSFQPDGTPVVADEPIDVVESKKLGRRRLTDLFYPSPCETPAEQYRRDLLCWLVVGVVAMAFVYFLLKWT